MHNKFINAGLLPKDLLNDGGNKKSGKELKIAASLRQTI